MNYQVFPDYEALSEHAAQFILAYIRQKPNATICVASGETPLLTFQKIVQKAQPHDFDQVTFVALDEWVGIVPNNAGSCRSYIDAPLIQPLGISPERVSFFDGLAEDLEAECSRVNAFIASKGGLDIIMVGIGMNGHLGLNEPGTSFDTYAHVSDLEEVTAAVGQKYFESATPLTQGITVGLKHFLEAKIAIVLANGEKKREIIRRVMEESVSERLPASALKLHTNSHLWVDSTANPT
ncbi:MAG: glucosamine-6-phosphate deaminase [Spirosomataceae bacterium]